MEILLSNLVSSIALGSIYALIITGMNLLLQVRGIIQWAYPSLVILCMYVAWLVGSWTGNWPAALVAAFVASIVLNVLTEPLFRPLFARRAVMETVVVAVGISMIITEVMSHYLNHGRPIFFPEDLLGVSSIRSGLIVISFGDILAVVASVVSVAIMLYYLYHSTQGRSMRALAQDVLTARVMGVNVNRTSMLSFALAGILGGVTSVLLILSIGSATATSSNRLLTLSASLMMFAGMGNITGGLICAYVLGVVENMSLAYLPGSWTDVTIFIIIMVTIIIRPSGIFGSRATIKFN